MQDATRLKEIWLAGVDGCRDGWIVALVRPDGDEARVGIVPRFSELVAAQPAPAIIGVDMPIGLPGPYRPWRTRGGKRGAAAAWSAAIVGVSVPSRAAVYAGNYGEARWTTLQTSEPPRNVAKQLFNIAPKIREIDAALRADGALAARTFEIHPEVAFWRLNGDVALSEPKKVKSRCHEQGLALRRRLLIAAGFPRAVVEGEPPKGAGPDDLLDAFACAAIARRIHAGIAKSFPQSPPRDAYGLPMAIWA